MSQKQLVVSSLVSVVASAILSGAMAQGASDTWTGNSNTLWSNTANWLGLGVPGTGDTATFDRSSANFAISIAPGVSIGQILFNQQQPNTGNAGYTFSAGSTFTFDAGGGMTLNATNDRNQVFNTPITLSGGLTLANNSFISGANAQTTLQAAGTLGLGANTATVSGSGTTLLGGQITGGGGLLKTGRGTLIVNQTNNSFSGGTTVSQGVLRLQGGNGLSSPTGGTSALSTAGTLVLGDGSTGANDISLFMTGTVASNNLYLIRPITVSASGSGRVTIGSDGGTGVGEFLPIYDGAITLNRSVYLQGQQTDRTQYRGGISGGGSLFVNGGQRTIFSDTVGLNGEGAGNGTALYTYTGNLYLRNSGTILQLNTNQVIPDSANVDVGVNTVLRSAFGKVETLGSLTGGGTVTAIAGNTTFTIGANNRNATFTGAINTSGGSNVAIVKTGTGTQSFGNAGTSATNNSYSLATTINGGTLAVNNLANGNSASGIGSSSNAAGNLVFGGGTLQLSGTNAAYGTDRNFTITTGTTGATIDVANSTTTLTVSGTASAASTGGLAKAGRGTLALNSATAFGYTGTTAANGGTLRLDFANMGTPTDLLNASSPLALGGGTLSLVAKNNVNSSQQLGNVSINRGAGVISLAPTGIGTMTLTLGNTYTQSSGGTLQFVNPASTTIVSNPALTNGIIGGYATYGITSAATDWATVNAGNIAPLGTYVNDTWASGNNTTVTVSSAPASGSTTSSLRFGNAGAFTVTLAGTNRIESGGILVNSSVGNNLSQISGGSLRPGAAIDTAADLLIHQHNTNNGLTIGSQIVNNGTGATTIVKSGAGSTTLSTQSTATGGLVVNEGNLTLSAGDFANGFFNSASGAPITINAGATLTAGADWITRQGGYLTPITINGGTMALGTRLAYMNVLTATGGSITGSSGDGSIRIGHHTLAGGYTNPIWTFNPSATGFTISSTVQIVNNGAGGPNLMPIIEVQDGAAADDLLISGVISQFSAGSGFYTKRGTGTMRIDGNNTYTGGVTLSQGTISIRNSNALGTGGNVTIGDTATGSFDTELTSSHTSGDLVLTRPITVTNNGIGQTTIGGRHTGGRTFFDGQLTLSKDVILLGAGADRTQFRGGITGTGNVTIDGGSRVTWSTTTSTSENGNGTAPYTFSGNIYIENNSQLQLNSDFIAGNQSLATKNLSIASGSRLTMAYSLDATFDALTGSGNVEGVASTGGTSVFTIGANNGSSTFAGRIFDNGTVVQVTKAGTGTINLVGGAGNNGYTGVTTVDGGVLGVGGSFAGDQAIRGNITVNSGGTYRALQNDVIINSSLVTVNASGTFDWYNFGDTIGLLAGAGNVINNNIGFTLDGTSSGASQTFSGVISGTAGVAYRGAVAGNTTQTFSGANTYTGITSITAGTLVVNTLANGGTASSIGASTNAAANLVLQGSAPGNATLRYTGGTTTIDRNFTLTGAAGGGTFDVNTGGVTLTTTGGGTGTGGLNKAGLGTLAIAGASNYAGGTNVNAGTLLVNDSQTGGGSYTVALNATLGGTGSTSSAVGVNGILSPGASIESFASGALTMNGGSTFVFEAVNNSVTGADLMVVNGGLLLTSASLDLTGANLSAGSWVVGDKLTLISYTGAPITSGFVGYNDDSTYLFGTNNWLFNYNDVAKGSNYALDAPAPGPGNSFVTLTLVPEPGSLTLMAFGIFVLFTLGKKRRA